MIIRRVHFLPGLLICLLFMTGCATMGGPVRGKVLDEASGEPIEGAIVVTRWIGHLASWAHGKTVCYHVESTVTEKTGDYHIPRWRDTNTEEWRSKIKPEEVYITAYKPGYVGSEKREKGVQYLKVFEGAREERLDYLKHLNVSCSQSGKSMRNLYPIYKSLYEEVKQLAETNEDQKWVQRFRKIAARSAVAEDGDTDMTVIDMDKLIDAYTKEHLQ